MTRVDRYNAAVIVQQAIDDEIGYLGSAALSPTLAAFLEARIAMAIEELTPKETAAQVPPGGRYGVH